MCRFVAYKGLPITVDELLFKPDHSLVKQSYHANEITEPLNGDGFGLGWYVPDLTPDPAVFAAISPAWNNRNLRYMSPKLLSPVIFAHVRAASQGDVMEANCHPFHYKNMLMMHNGNIAGFRQIKRALMRRLSDARFDWIRGSTDSEYLFALFLDHYLAQSERHANAMAQALTTTFKDIKALEDDAGITAPSYLNMVISDGNHMLGARYVDDASVTPNSLHHTEGSRYMYKNGKYRMHPVGKQEQAVIIASEPLTNEAPHWHDVPPRHFILVDENADTSFRAIDL